MFRWKEFLDVARRLRAAGDVDEAALRTVVGRVDQSQAVVRGGSEGFKLGAKVYRG